MLLTHPRIQKSKILSDNASSAFSPDFHSGFFLDAQAIEVRTSEILADVWLKMFARGPSSDGFVLLLTGSPRFTSDTNALAELIRSTASSRAELLIDEEMPLAPSQLATSHIAITYRHVGSAESVISSSDETSLLME